jgi:hypothetical protein
MIVTIIAFVVDVCNKKKTTACFLIERLSFLYRSGSNRHRSLLRSFIISQQITFVNTYPEIVFRA